MSDTKRISLRITQEQYSIIKTKTQLNGYISMNAFIRDRTMQLPYKTEQQLIEIYQELKKRNKQ